MPNNMGKKNIISLDTVSFKFPGQSKHALHAYKDISFTVEDGEFVSIVGPSGCGKSTLLRSILGLQKGATGNISRGYTKAAMVFQGAAIFPWLTVYENIAFGLEMEGKSKTDIQKIVEEKIHEVGLSGHEDKYPKELSGGMKQRVGVARALAVSPDFLVMDEPFSSVDYFTAKKLKDDLLILFKKYDMAVLFVTHLIAEAIELSDRIIVLSKRPGTMKADIPVDLPRPRNPRSPEFFTLLDTITGLIDEA